MRLLSKAGFTQSYTYFTWRTDAKSLRKYLTELTKTEMRQYYRGNLFTNTPDINPHYLARGRSTFVSRLVLAATLSGLYGIYSGFELLEHRRIGRTEEYVDSEKYEIIVRDWDAAGNLKPLIETLNRLRRAWPALQRTETLRFEAVARQADAVLPQGAARRPDGPPVRGAEALAAAGVGRGQRLTHPGRAGRPPPRSGRGRHRSRRGRIGTRTCSPERPAPGRSRTITATLGPDRPFVIFTLAQDPGAEAARRPAEADERPETGRPEL